MNGNGSFPGLRELARLLGGEAFGNNILAPGPGHSRRDRSLSITLDPSRPYGIRVNTFSQDDKAACWRHVCDKLGLTVSSSSENRAPAGGASRRREDCRGAATDDAERTARAQAIWAESRPPAGAPVQTYLERRGLALPDGAEEAIRFHPACPFGPGKCTPAMVALVRDVVTDAPKAIHRTALTLDGDKAEVDGKDRLALGPIAGGAVKITPDEDVTLALGIGEGIETTLSLRELPEFGASPVWALLSASGVERFPVPAGIECLWIAVDRDEAGEKAARACAERWRAAGQEVFMVRPKVERADLNDTVKGRRRHGSR
jgi:hypothetical protein